MRSTFFFFSLFTCACTPQGILPGVPSLSPFWRVPPAGFTVSLRLLRYVAAAQLEVDPQVWLSSDSRMNRMPIPVVGWSQQGGASWRLKAKGWLSALQHRSEASLPKPMSRMRESLHKAPREAYLAESYHRAGKARQGHRASKFCMRLC